jgi:thiol-disulfide isomerase/thioredoxin
VKVTWTGELVGALGLPSAIPQAHWCPPCQRFTPILKDFYEVNPTGVSRSRASLTASVPCILRTGCQRVWQEI